MKGIILTIGLLIGTSLVLSSQTKINWLSWDEALKLHKEEKKKIFVDVYTNWCGWCKKMDAATFQKEHIAEYINENYYAVKFNAEQKEDIIFRGKTYKFVNQGRRGYHELAAQVTKGRLSYPTIVFLDENLNVIQPIPGFQDPRSFEMIMTYFAGNYFQNTPWRKYTQTYVSMLDKDKSKVPVKTAGNQNEK